MKPRNKFIAAAMEELNQEAAIATTGEQAVQVSTPAVTQVNVDSSTDAVAALMEQNSQLVDVNATLESETFDNDLDAIETSSDSVHQDLEDACAAGAGLEQLADIIDAGIKAGQITSAAVAGYAMALEAYSHRGGLDNPIPALEAEALQLEGPESQAKAIGDTARSKAGELAQRLMDGIKRIIGWLMNMLRSLFSRAKGVRDRANKAQALIDSIDESKTITSGAFISSLRLVEGGGDVNKQFQEYAALADKTLYGVFNRSFIDHMNNAISHAKNEGGSDADVVEGARQQMVEIIKTLLGSIYTEHGTGADVSGHLPDNVTEQELTVGKTVPCVGGLQLYLAATLSVSRTDNGAPFYCQAGAVKNPPKFETPESIPVADKATVKRMLGTVEKWMAHQSHFEAIFSVLQKLNLHGQRTLTMETVKAYLSTLTALASGCVPHLLRLNLQNAVNYVAYVEKSAAVSQGAADPEKK